MGPKPNMLKAFSKMEFSKTVKGDQIHFNSVDPTLVYSDRTDQGNHRRWPELRAPQSATLSPCKFESEYMIAVDVTIAEAFGCSFTQAVSLHVLCSKDIPPEAIIYSQCIKTKEITFMRSPRKPASDPRLSDSVSCDMIR